MTEIQLTVAQWVAALAAVLPFGYSFAAGMVAAVNPCGFAMLPAYISLFLGTQTLGYRDNPPPTRAFRALLLGATVTLGFVVLFGTAGALIALGGRFLIQLTPWFAVVIGVAMVGLGVWLLAGGSLSLAVASRIETRLIEDLASRDTGEITRAGPWVFFAFGVAYGIASLSCTLPIFLLAVGNALASGGLITGAVQFLSYALGMGLVVTLLTLSAAVFQGFLALYLQRVLPHIERVSALLLMGAGGYLVYYWARSGLLL